MILSGLSTLPWWANALLVFAGLQLTLAGVSVYLHRAMAHRALDVHPAVSHVFRFWLWLTTGMITREWVAIHRKHHAKCETEEDPHSPVTHGINKVLWGGVLLYVKESRKPETMEKYGVGCPDDWMERNVYTPHEKLGVTLLALIDIALFGFVPGLLFFLIQIAWIPFWAAGVINGIGHWFGYRNYQSEDASTNIWPWALWICGEELHNNHHAYPSSAKFSQRWYEFDLGWVWISVLEAVGLANVKRVAPPLRLQDAKSECDAETLQGVIAHRYEVMARFAKSVREATTRELQHLREKGHLPQLKDAAAVKRLREWLHTDHKLLSEDARTQIRQAVESSKMIAMLQQKQAELASLWERSSLSTEQLAKRLEAWCKEAEASGIEALAVFSMRLRRYAA